MRCGAALPFVLLLGGVTGCAASTAPAERTATELQARADADREHARLVEIEVRLLEMEQRLASQTRACEAPGDSPAESAPAEPQPLRSEGDFSTEARVVTASRPAAPAAGASAAKVSNAAAATLRQSATPASERERLEQLLEGLREYASNPKSGLSLERREALRVLLRRERQLDLMNPWANH